MLDQHSPASPPLSGHLEPIFIAKRVSSAKYSDLLWSMSGSSQQLKVPWCFIEGSVLLAWMRDFCIFEICWPLSRWNWWDYSAYFPVKDQTTWNICGCKDMLWNLYYDPEKVIVRLYTTCIHYFIVKKHVVKAAWDNITTKRATKPPPSHQRGLSLTMNILDWLTVFCPCPD